LEVYVIERAEYQLLRDAVEYYINYDCAVCPLYVFVLLFTFTHENCKKNNAKF